MTHLSCSQRIALMDLGAVDLEPDRLSAPRLKEAVGTWA
jgi:hypothetical protein